MMALGDSILSGEDYANLIDEEDKRMRALYEVNAVEPTSSVSIAELRAFVRSLENDWELLEVTAQKKMIRSMFRKITIEKATCDWKIVDLLTV